MDDHALRPRADPGAGALLVLVTETEHAIGGLAVAAALGIAAAAHDLAPGGVILCDGAPSPARRRPTLLASVTARRLETQLRGDLPAVARGALCWATLGEEWPHELGCCRVTDASLVVAYLPPARWRGALVERSQEVHATVLRADLPRDRALAALAACELRQRGFGVGVVSGRPGLVASRRALAGIEPGGRLGDRAGRLARRLLRSDGQALPAVLALALAIVALGALLVLLGAAATGGSRLQRAADLAAVSAARSLLEDHPRRFAPARTPTGKPNPDHLGERAYRARARRSALGAVRANLAPVPRARVGFPGRGFAPTRVRVSLGGPVMLGSERTETRARAIAVAEAYPAGGQAPTATGGGYSGPLAYRQGKPMRPDVARAFDRLAAAARRDGHGLTVNSAFRSNSEQAALFAANPDPRWVAPPGTSLHRCGTELDLGPSAAYGWLAASAHRFGFELRYAWEPWHFGFVAGPGPCSAAAERGARSADGSLAAGGVQSFVPARFRVPIARAADRHNVSAGLLGAQLLAESNFNPLAVSPAGARGIAQFMPGTAAAYGLRNPFDPAAAIDAQARLMSDLLGRYGRVDLALAAYNAGPAPVDACGCIPPYAETQAYVAKILGLLGGAGEQPPPVLKVRLVR